MLSIEQTEKTLTDGDLKETSILYGRVWVAILSVIVVCKSPQSYLFWDQLLKIAVFMKISSEWRI